MGIRVLLHTRDLGANINLQNQFGKTAPMYAIEMGKRDKIERLLKDQKTWESLNVNLRDYWGMSLVMYTHSCMCMFVQEHS